MNSKSDTGQRSDSRKLHVEYMEAAAAFTANSFSELLNVDDLHIVQYQNCQISDHYCRKQIFYIGIKFWTIFNACLKGENRGKNTICKWLIASKLHTDSIHKNTQKCVSKTHFQR